jgi:hypothetical protein
MRGRLVKVTIVRGLLALSVGCALALGAGAEALATEYAPGWEVNSNSYPTNLAPGSSAAIGVGVYNIGGAESAAGAVITDTLPAGVEGLSGEGWSCSGGMEDVCTYELPPVISSERREFVVKINVSPTAAEGAFKNLVTVSGGGAPTSASVAEPTTISSTPAKFGLVNENAWASNANGTLDTQAGSHPYEFTHTFTMSSNQNAKPNESELRSVTVELPPGLIGNATAVPRCSREAFDHESCPTGSQIGIAPSGLGGEAPLFQITFAVYNLVPPPGHPAEFGFTIFNNDVFLDASVRSNGDYGITEHVNDLPERLIVTSAVTIWGDPADHSHDSQRTCYSPGGTEYVGCPSSEGHTAFLTLPTACTGPERYSATVNEWSNELITDRTSVLSHTANDDPIGLSGCDRLNFNPSLSVAPDTSNADTPAGLTVELKTPQEGLTAHEGIATSNIKDTTVTLPEGVAINPGQAAGLAACQAGEDAVGTEAAPTCPSASKVGTDEIETPLLKNALKGNVYVLQSNPPNLKLLVAASGEGVNLKLVGNVHLDETTGRLTTTFTETPELPFTTFRLSFSGGAQAALTTPARCGSYTTTSDFTPWSAPYVPDVFPTSEFVISHGPSASACAGSQLPFSPSLTAGSTTDQAGGYTDFSLLLTREDGQQRIGALQFKTPEGLLGMISKVPLCPEAQASQGTCAAASQIGHTVVEAGPGPYPLVVPQPGQPPAPIYLTGGYKGAPYGLSIVVPLVVGPFTLQTQIVRAKIEVDPLTSQLTITTDPLPTIIDGIPADLRAINAVIDKSGFMFNPTGCQPQAFTGTATGTEGAVAPISSHFQMGSCRSLTFKPDFKVSTGNRPSRANGASLDAKIVYPTGELGANQASGQSNIKSVKVELPKQLPSRLTTLQKACTAATFEANPANCPADSTVGSATAITPVLPVPLSGPAYFVSYGSAKFPELVVVLQGYGVTVDLHGETFISKAGITSSTFHEVPDVPITSFELKLPQGPYSALAANLPASAKGSTCAQKLTMPTEFVGQNGAVIRQSTPIEVTGCSRALAIASHSVKKTTATIAVYVPAAGSVKVSGNGLPTKSAKAKGRETLTFKLRQKQAGRQSTKVIVLFTPNTGKDRKRESKLVNLKFQK